VVAHDFGAAVAWVLAALHPDRVERLVALSVGHPNARDRSLEGRQRAWYQLWFQFEGVAEEVLTRDDWKLFRDWSKGAPDLERYLVDLSRPGALVAGLNWYRANTQPARELQSRPFPPVAAPTLGLWSSGDEYLTEASVRDSGAHVTGGWRYERIEGASHWLQLDAAERVNELLLDFLLA
jgi:pimeloyl-ACP methyl ester carboxylesterase